MGKRDVPQLRPHQFKPGQSGNPKGRPLNPIPRALKKLTVETYRKVIEVVCTGNIDELQRMVHDPNVSALQVGVANAFIKAMKNGDYATIERIAERIVGKIPDELNLNSKNMNTNLDVNIDAHRVKALIQKLESEV